MVPQKTQTSRCTTVRLCLLLRSSYQICHGICKPVSSLTSEQSKTLEAVQQRACQIIIGGGTYSRNCSSLKLDSLLPVTGRQQQTKKLFNQIVSKPEHCLHYLLPTARKQSVTDRLRPANKLPRIFAKTNRFKNSFMCYMLNSLQCE